MKVTKYGLNLSLDRHPVLMDEYTVYAGEWPVADTPRRSVDLLIDAFHINEKFEEYVYMICLDGKLRPIGVFEVSHGTSNKSLLGPKETYQRALLCGAFSIIIAHNHPSGNVTPSEDDIAICQRLKRSGDIIGIPMVDFMIIAGGDSRNYMSFEERGYLD